MSAIVLDNECYYHFCSRSGAATQGVEDMTATQLRDSLIATNPLDQQWIIEVNKAEAEFWKRNSGYRVGWSDEILGFDCGGQQWVLEVAFPTTGEKGTVGKAQVRFHIPLSMSQ